MRYLFITILFAYSFSVFGQVTLNEMQSSNNATIADEQGEFDDWIELYNPTDEAIEIGGLVLKDQVDTWAIPTGDPATLIPPNAYFLLWADDQEFQGAFHTNFKLASGGEFLGLYESDSSTVIDSLTIPALAANDSYFKCNDEWAPTSMPTPLQDNDCMPSFIQNRLTSDLFEITMSGNKQLEISNKLDLGNSNTVSVYSLDGNQLMQEKMDTARKVLDLSLLPTDIYLLIIKTDDGIYFERIAL